MAGALAGAAALAVGVAAMASGPEDGPHRASPAAEAAAPPAAPTTTVGPAISPPVTTAPPAAHGPTTSVPPAPATPAAVSGDAGDEYDEYDACDVHDYCGYGEHVEYRACGGHDAYGDCCEYAENGVDGECGVYGDSVPAEEHVFEPLADGRYAAFLVSVTPDPAMVELDLLNVLTDAVGVTFFANPDDQLRLMYVTPGYDLTGFAASTSDPHWVTVENGFVTGLEPAPWDVFPTG
jgi:hypothetical protein